MVSWHTPYEETNGESAPDVTCAREKHSYEIGMCDQECALHAGALNKSNVRVDIAPCDSLLLFLLCVFLQVFLLHFS